MNNLKSEVELNQKLILVGDKLFAEGWSTYIVDEGKTNKMYTKALKEAIIGQEINNFSPSDYNSLMAARTTLKRKEQYQSWNWQIKLGGGKVTVKRTS